MVSKSTLFFGQFKKKQYLCALFARGSVAQLDRATAF